MSPNMLGDFEEISPDMLGDFEFEYGKSYFNKIEKWFWGKSLIESIANDSRR